MSGMTVRQIAAAAGVSRDTVERAVRRDFPAVVQKGIETVLDQDQAEAVMLAVRKVNFVSLPQSADALPQLADAAKRLPSGAQLTRLESIYGKAGAGARLDSLMGWAPVTAITAPAIMPGAERGRELVSVAHSPDPAIERKLGFIREKFYAKREADRRRDRLQIRLPL